MAETWVYESITKQQHRAYRWGFWGVDIGCGRSASHTLLSPCQDGQDVCPTCARGVNSWKGSEDAPRRGDGPSVFKPGEEDRLKRDNPAFLARCKAEEERGTRIPLGEIIDTPVEDGDEWE